jgi:hypothetical protein
MGVFHFHKTLELCESNPLATASGRMSHSKVWHWVCGTLHQESSRKGQFFVPD